jgi:hypothetical protein
MLILRLIPSYQIEQNLTLHLTIQENGNLRRPKLIQTESQVSRWVYVLKKHDCSYMDIYALFRTEKTQIRLIQQVYQISMYT